LLDEPRDVLCCGGSDQSAHRSLLFYPSRSHHHHFVRESARLSEIVAHQQRRQRELMTQRIEGLLKFGPRYRVEGAKRFVEQDYARARSYAPGESRTLTLAAGKLVRKPVAELRSWKSNQLECLSRRIDGVGHFSKQRHERNVSKHTPVRQQSTVLLDVSHPSAQQYSGLRADILVTDADLTT